MVYRVTERRQLLVYGNLNPDNMARAMADLQFGMADGGVEVMISSGGGMTDPAFALGEVMLAVRRDAVLRTIATGRVASAAVLLLAAGTPGERYLLGGSDVMLHESSCYFDNPVSKTTTEWEDWVRGRRDRQDCYWAMLARGTGRTAEFWRERIERRGDVVMSATEACELGIVDHVVDVMPPVLKGKEPDKVKRWSRWRRPA